MEQINFSFYQIGDFADEYKQGVDYIEELLSHVGFGNLTYHQEWKDWFGENIDARTTQEFIILKSKVANVYAKVGVEAASLEILINAAVNLHKQVIKH